MSRVLAGPPPSSRSDSRDVRLRGDILDELQGDGELLEASERYLGIAALLQQYSVMLGHSNVRTVDMGQRRFNSLIHNNAAGSRR